MIYPGLLLQNRYRVIRRLGRGGIGETWEVDDGGTPKVLKVLLDNFPKIVELFKREAEVLKLLNHPGIPKVDWDGYFTEEVSAASPSQISPDVATQTASAPGATTQTTANSPSNISGQNQSEPLHCLVMELIKGQDLEKWLEQRGNQPIAQEQALAWLKQLVEILAQVHEHKYFHRDIKPSNIMRRPDGQLVLIDFGAVRQMTATYIEKREIEAVTRIYSLGYTAPEQFRGQAVPQSDFFALGRTFVYLLTGKAPKDFQEDPDTFQFEKNWRDSAPQVSKPLADLIDDLMEPSKDKRPEGAQNILQRIARLEIELSIEPIFQELAGPMRFLARQILKHAYQQWVNQTRIPTIALYGRTNSGKSSLINAIMGKLVARVGTGAEPTTPDNDSYECERNGYKLQFIDSRGVGELSTGESSPEEAFQQAIDYIVKRKIDILLFVVLATEVGYSDEDVKFLKTLKEAHQKAHKANLPIILVINKIDNATPSSEWSPPYNLSLLHSGDSSRKPRTAKEAKEANIINCIEKRSIQYKYLTHAYVPVCTCWNNYEDKRYNIDELELQIYNLISDEAAKDGFGKGTADKRLKKAVASRFTSAAAWLAFSVVWLPFFDANSALVIQKRLVITIAQIASSNENHSSSAETFLQLLGVQKTDARESALSMTLTIGDAAIRYFIDKEEIIDVQQNYAQEEGRLEPEFREAFQGGKTKVFRKLQEIDAELHDRYGVKRIYEEENGDNNINYTIPLPL